MWPKIFQNFPLGGKENSKIFNFFFQRQNSVKNAISGYCFVLTSPPPPIHHCTRHYKRPPVTEDEVALSAMVLHLE